MVSEDRRLTSPNLRAGLDPLLLDRTVIRDHPWRTAVGQSVVGAIRKTLSSIEVEDEDERD